MFRWEVIVTGFVLAFPVLALGLRGDFTLEETATRVLMCLGAGWFAVSLLRWAAQPRSTPSTPPVFDDLRVAPQEPTPEATQEPTD